MFGLLRLIVDCVKTYPPVFKDGTWSAVTTPGSAAYHPFWGALIVFEIAGNLALIAASLVLLVKFFGCSRTFPKVFIAYSAAFPLFVLLDTWLVSFVLPEEPMFDRETTRTLANALTASAIWVPYMLRSRRVKNTFVV